MNSFLTESVIAFNLRKKRKLISLFVRQYSIIRKPYYFDVKPFMIVVILCVRNLPTSQTGRSIGIYVRQKEPKRSLSARLAWKQSKSWPQGSPTVLQAFKKEDWVTVSRCNWSNTNLITLTLGWNMADARPLSPSMPQCLMEVYLKVGGSSVTALRQILYLPWHRCCAGIQDKNLTVEVLKTLFDKQTTQLQSQRG